MTSTVLALLGGVGLRDDSLGGVGSGREVTARLRQRDTSSDVPWRSQVFLAF